MAHIPQVSPKLQSISDSEEHKVTWLELFYDLVYVAALIQLGNALSDDVSPVGFMRFVVVFVPVWWAWTGITFYMNRFKADDVVHRFLIYLQIVAIAFLGISIADAFGTLTTQFALSYAAIRLILVLLYVRTWRSVPATRPLTQRYVTAHLVGIGLWIVSAFLPMPWAAALWIIALTVEIGNVFTPGTRALQSQLPPDSGHMRERYGIFVIIVLGESFIKTITAGAGLAINADILLFSLLGIFVTLALWWLYFDEAETSVFKPAGYAPYAWIYGHLPLTLGLTAFGVGAKKVFLAAGEAYVKPDYLILFCGALSLYALGLALIDAGLLIGASGGRAIWSVGRRLLLAVTFALLPYAQDAWSALHFIAVVAVIMSVAVAFDAWLHARNGRDVHRPQLR